jgi:phosphate transport system substrate-binding protein
VSALHTCAVANTELILSISEVPTSALDVKKTDLAFRIGGAPGNAYAAAVSDESIVLIVNSRNPVLSLPTEELKNLFIGRITNWAEVGGAQQSVQIWVYPDGEDIRSIFDVAILPGESLTSMALIAPDPLAMLEAVADDPSAIGYVPQAWLAQTKDVNQIRPLNINPKLAEELRQPVLALSSIEPDGPIRQLLGCMQSAGH